MNLRDTERLLIGVSAMDHRNVTDELVKLWQVVLNDVAYDDAIRVLPNHWRHSTAYLMPAHIVKLIEAETPSVDPIDVHYTGRNIMAQLYDGHEFREQWLAERGLTQRDLDEHYYDDRWIVFQHRLPAALLEAGH